MRQSFHLSVREGENYSSPTCHRAPLKNKKKKGAWVSRSINRQLRSSPRRVRCSWVKVPSVELGGSRRNSREPVRAVRQEG
jgi:hypothetical protein